MSDHIYISNISFQLIRKRAKKLAKELKLPLHETLELASVEKGFKNWHQVTIQKKQYDESIAEYYKYPILFLDIKDAEEVNSSSLLIRLDESLEICSDILWEKPKIRQCLLEREDDLVGFMYKKVPWTFDAVSLFVEESLFFSPGFVFFDSSFIPYDDFIHCSKNKNEIKKYENTFVLWDRTEHLLDKFQSGMNSAILNFTGYSLFKTSPYQVYDAQNWDYQKISDFIIDMRVDELILINPKKGLDEDIGHIVGQHLVHTSRL